MYIDTSQIPARRSADQLSPEMLAIVRAGNVHSFIVGFACCAVLCGIAWLVAS